MSNPPRPNDFVMPTVNGIDVVMMIDHKFTLNQDIMKILVEGTSEYIKSVFTPSEARTLIKNHIWWNIPYAQSKLETIPEPFHVRNDRIFIHYYPPAELNL